MSDDLYRLRDPQYAPYITARILTKAYYPFRNNLRVYEVELTDTRKPAYVQSWIVPSWEADHFHRVFEWSALV